MRTDEQLKLDILSKFNSYWPFASQRLLEALARNGRATFTIEVEVANKKYYIRASLSDGAREDNAREGNTK
jgi:hypothetical protein